MLLKIYTCQNSVKIIPDITDIEVHQWEYRFESYSQLYDAISFGPGMIRATNCTPSVECFDYDVNESNTPSTTPNAALAGKVVRFIDYERNNIWRRVAIQNYAYLCNDVGKTIEKIGVPFAIGYSNPSQPLTS